MRRHEPADPAIGEEIEGFVAGGVAADQRMRVPFRDSPQVLPWIGGPFEINARNREDQGEEEPRGDGAQRRAEG